MNYQIAYEDWVDGEAGIGTQAIVKDLALDEAFSICAEMEAEWWIRERVKNRPGYAATTGHHVPSL